MSLGVTRQIWHLGKRVTFRTLCQRFGLSYKTLWRRYQRGDRGKRLVRPTETQYAHRGNWGHETHTENSHLHAFASSAAVA